MHEKRVEIRWRDVDALGHVNSAVYATYLEECRDEWLERGLGDDEAAWDFVVARLAIDFRSELRIQDDVVVAACGLAQLGTSSVTTKETMVAGDKLVAEAEAVLVARNRERTGSRPLTDTERASLERAG